ncbi:hypothetical protein [Vulcaniibacterium tengchongense]|uniref:PGAP1-like protein n=1 Tax=Vulcaniibacterium tengchongense TaxID=1273429 RepID=A0A3N4VLB5_9GAMM|nr:hypothetical protein [Vulcaniibacterium tengchongense]RPE74670.1 PGAP1-like protein [Vulcaniibacterium tengchongense]
MSVPPDKAREAIGALGSQGQSRYEWSLTSSALLDPVRLVLPPPYVLPVIFVPGIMGSNLMDTDGNKVWRLDTTFGQPLGLARKMAFSGPAARQRLMHPARTQVDPRGNVPGKAKGSVSNKSQYREERFWGEIAESSYHEFLLWLEDRLNGQGYNPARWQDFFYTAVSAAPKPGERPSEPKLHPGIPMQMRGFNPLGYLDGEAGVSPRAEVVTSDDLLKRAKFRMPVYACGYNWLDSNTRAAERLKGRIDQVIAANNRNGYKCEQVILITHSMGGLVARRCALMAGMQDKIAGIVHGVMPAVGAAVAYRRCKVGMRDEDFVAGLVIGSNGREVTAVFSQAPGALQLLPSREYRSNWLKIKDANGRDIETQPSTDPYVDIYLKRDRWWGLVREEWLRPEGGRPLAWDEYAANVRIAKSFHEQIQGEYHPVTYVYYGADSDQASFETVCWRMKAGIKPDSRPAPTPAQVRDMRFDQVREDGSNPFYVGGKLEVVPAYGYMAPASTYQSSYWELHAEKQDGGGDGTVPTSSGRAPLFLGKHKNRIRQQFRLTGFGHEPSYKDQRAQQATLFGLSKIVAAAKIPT